MKNVVHLDAYRDTRPRPAGQATSPAQDHATAVRTLVPPSRLYIAAMTAFCEPIKELQAVCASAKDEESRLTVERATADMLRSLPTLPTGARCGLLHQLVTCPFSQIGQLATVQIHRSKRERGLHARFLSVWRTIPKDQDRRLAQRAATLLVEALHLHETRLAG